MFFSKALKVLPLFANFFDELLKHDLRIPVLSDDWRHGFDNLNYQFLIV